MSKRGQEERLKVLFNILLCTSFYYFGEERFSIYYLNFLQKNNSENPSLNCVNIQHNIKLGL